MLDVQDDNERTSIWTFEKVSEDTYGEYEIRITPLNESEPVKQHKF